MNRTKLISGMTIIALLGTTAAAMARDDNGPKMGQRGAGGPGGAMLIEQFDAIDADANGEITQAEIEAHAKARFDAADSDGNGSLSADELKAQAEERRAERMARMQERMIDRADENDDGEISFDEMKRAPMDKMFDRVDADDSGSLSKEELDEMAKRFADRRGGPRGHGDRPER